MKSKLSFEFESGYLTCAVEKGKFCKFFRGDIFGKDSCAIFGRVFADEPGWIRRHPDCLKKAERINE